MNKKINMRLICNLKKIKPTLFCRIVGSLECLYACAVCVCVCYIINRKTSFHINISNRNSYNYQHFIRENNKIHNVIRESALPNTCTVYPCAHTAASYFESMEKTLENKISCICIV